jgi:hypothetical protein
MCIPEKAGFIPRTSPAEMGHSRNIKPTSLASHGRQGTCQNIPVETACKHWTMKQIHKVLFDFLQKFNKNDGKQPIDFNILVFAQFMTLLIHLVHLPEMVGHSMIRHNSSLYYDCLSFRMKFAPFRIFMHSFSNENL